MAGARHAAPPARGRVHRLANALCTTVVVVGVTAVVLGGRVSGHADMTDPSEGLLAVGRAVVPDGLFPGAVVSGRLPVSNDGAQPAQVTRVAFDVPVADAGHPDCRPGSVVPSADVLPLVPAGAAQSIRFSVSMSPAVGDACQGATFTARYQVTARPA